MANPNTIYAQTFVDELIRQGLKHVVFAPGSRNTPLVLAFANRQDHIRIWSQLDERSASFFALGLAVAIDAPVAIICTSGSAVANMFPAVIEAHESRIPMIVISADRPYELRHSGANQTIDQIKLFGDYARWFVDAPLPEADAPVVAMRQIRTMADRAYQVANGIRKGVVHINMPFRKPLEPDGDESTLPLEIPPQTQFYPAQQQVSASVVASFVALLKQYPRGMIVCGTRIQAQDFAQIQALAHKTGYPILADGASGMRFFAKGDDRIIGAYDTFLMTEQPALMPDLVVRFGDVPTSKWLNEFLGKATPQARILVRPDNTWADDQHHTTHVIEADISALIEQTLVQGFPHEAETHSAWLKRFQDIERATWEIIESRISAGMYFDGGVVYDTLNLLPDNTTLFIGNSLPVRHLDQFAKPMTKTIRVHANRGASGIDGNLSTALGLGAGRPDTPLVAIVGDITFYHDMNGLLAIRRLGIPITIVLINNDSGGIFHRLPIRAYEPAFTDYFLTPHGLDFSHVAKLYGLEFIGVEDQIHFREVFSACMKQNTQHAVSHLIEVRTDAPDDLAQRKQIIQAVQAQLEALNL